MSEARESGKFRVKIDPLHSGLVSSPIFKQGELVAGFRVKSSAFAFARAENYIPFDYGYPRYRRGFRPRRRRGQGLGFFTKFG